MGTALRTPHAPQPELYRFSRLDFITVGLYVAVAGLFAVAGSLLEPLLLQISPNPAVASYAVNLIFYATVGALALTAARHVAVRDLRVLATRPWFTALLVLVGPFVEEYIFRHLLIGKLSRRVNLWVCCIMSVVLFAALHIVGQEQLTLKVLITYLAMGAVLVFVYVWTGKNVMFSYFVHASKNLLAVI